MQLKHILPLFIIASLWSCDSKTVAKSSDYNTYLNTAITAEDLQDDIDFWTLKIKNSSSPYAYFISRAQAKTKVFNSTGNINYLIDAENDLLKAKAIVKDSDAGLLRQIASNYISQHRFKEALVLLKQAEKNGEKLNSTKKMLFDVHLELGNYIYAEAYLNDIKNEASFDYLLRLSKLEDHKGNLDTAIEHMEEATAIAEASNLKNLKLWSYTNSADFYGHAGNINKSYTYYLKALALDPNNAYAKKGIAWIAYANDNNPDEALRILNHITTYYNAPDYDLFKAEIAEYKHNDSLKTKHLNHYLAAIDNKLYGEMYNKYNVLLFSEDLENPDRALELAKREIENRATPQSYDLLAWSYYKQGQVAKAEAIMDEFVVGKTFEPAVLYHIAEIYKASGNTDKILPLKTELLASLYELGPLMKQKINQL
ncbi:tetratricopeptide repeat protein [Winogradskyella arenosi]|uniref:Tetratricopeptide repeat protein n=1 Tax=Winogradskyella arenosi TaxID=533325 RepID=A0A368ZFE7_9FLAO|nr:tetratricopeptide repeat protein [Winogradskyella arenosi]RCW92254.1 tetratricopeptide repeat protein [Winogradskyella arenosi]